MAVSPRAQTDAGAANAAGAGLRFRPTPAAEPGLYTGPVDVVAVPGGGAVVVFVRPTTGRRAQILAQRLDPDGQPSGPPRTLRGTTGPITALDADLSGDRLWVAWVANPGGDPNAEDVLGEQRVAALAASADLGLASQPVRMLDYRVGTQARPWTYPAVEIVGRAGGGALAVSHGPSQQCHHDEGGGGHDTACPGWVEHSLGADGAHRAEVHGVLAGSRPPFSLVRAAEAGAVLVGDDHIGDKVHAWAVSSATAPPTHDLGVFWNVRSPRLAAVGPTTYFFGNYDPVNGDAVLPRVRAWGPEAGAAGGDAGAVLRGHTLGCVEGRPVVRYTWPGGGVELDPGRSGASFDLARHLPEGALDERLPALAWAGRVLVGADPAHGTLERWRCVGGRLRPVGATGHGGP